MQVCISEAETKLLLRSQNTEKKFESGVAVFEEIILMSSIAWERDSLERRDKSDDDDDDDDDDDVDVRRME